jgi:hypothetical protein
LVTAPTLDAADVVSEAFNEDAADGDATESSDEARESSTTTLTSVMVGLDPTAQTVLDGGTPQAGQLDAVLLSMATGARGLTATVPWADLEGDGTSAAWKRLESLAGLLRAQKRMLTLSIPAVDGTLDGRPSSLQGAGWDAATTKTAMEAMVDQLYAKLGSELRYLSLGFEVDRYASADPAQRDAFLTFAQDVVQYANTHPNRENAQAGVTWSHEAWLSEPTPATWAPGLVGQSDVVMVSYTPLGADLRVGPADSVHGDLPAMILAATDRPLVLTNVSYPSSVLIGGSEDEQAHFFELLFLEVEAHRAKIPFVAVSSLHDPESESCHAKAAAMGQPESLELYVYWCSTGLRTLNGTPKKAFDSFRTGAAALLDP